MTATRAFPFLCHAIGATAARTPLTVANVLAIAAGAPEVTRAAQGESGAVPTPDRLRLSRAIRAGPRCASEFARGLPNWIVAAARASAPRIAIDTTAAIQRWR